MPEREQISQPTLGSNEVGTETSDIRVPNDISAGTDTQTHLAAKSGKHSKEDKIENVKHNLEGTDFIQADETDE